jgi:hypothetical protein
MSLSAVIAILATVLATGQADTGECFSMWMKALAVVAIFLFGI